MVQQQAGETIVEAHITTLKAALDCIYSERIESTALQVYTLRRQQPLLRSVYTLHLHATPRTEYTHRTKLIYPKKEKKKKKEKLGAI
jgi:hypothetical protein